jgi:adenylate cyclase
MPSFSKHWARIAVTLLPLVFAMLHATGHLRLNVLQRLDDIIYDARLRATMPKTLDDRIVIVDIDEKSLAEVGRWPWGRNKLADLINELFDRQHIALAGFDVVFAEPDESSGLKRLNELARNELRDQTGFTEKLKQLQEPLDYDGLFAKSLEKRPVVLGYVFLGADGEGRAAGQLPAPVMQKGAMQGRSVGVEHFQGYSSNIDLLAKAAPMAGFFNPAQENDGVVRSVYVVADYKGTYYESLSSAMYRMLEGQPTMTPGFPSERFVGRGYQNLESIVLTRGNQTRAIPVDDHVRMLVPFRGFGGPTGGSFKYVSASDLLSKKIPQDALKGKIIIVGTTAAGLKDQRITPVGEVYPGVEAHANVISGLLDDKILNKPDWSDGYEVLNLAIAGLILAFTLPLVSAPRAVVISAVVLVVLVGTNLWLYLGAGLVLPLASALVMAVTAFALNMSYGYFVESRSKRELANLFGTYVPPELVDEMAKDPAAYSMQAANKELTVMFCDMRGFTKMSESMEPLKLQELLTGVFSRLTAIIRHNNGTIDKYMGDCVMAFWGAPVETPDHAQLAVKSAMEMAAAIVEINAEHQAKGIPQIGIGIGLNTGMMCVGDMGSDIRKAYTVIGDAVNLGSRLEGLSKAYGTDIVVSETTRQLAGEFAWQELDKVRVKGKEQAVAIFRPIAAKGNLDSAQAAELKAWGAFMKAYRSQDWDQCDMLLFNLLRMDAKKYLYQVYSERIASMRMLPFDPEWDGATNFETK